MTFLLLSKSALFFLHLFYFIYLFFSFFFFNIFYILRFEPFIISWLNMKCNCCYLAMNITPFTYCTVVILDFFYNCAFIFFLVQKISNPHYYIRFFIFKLICFIFSCNFYLSF
uniref:Uncharacterized protein n=1 Tax=Cacopsylla melanoneura TaxID=428564 RepID=A0A8D8RMG1_9HEMI